MRGGDLLIECLKAQGVTCVFGMPGTQNIQIYDSLLRRGGNEFEHFLVRHEYAASIMADGYARATGDVGVALTVPGPGSSNASTGILQAYTDCVPVLLITGQHDSKHYSRHPSKHFHGLDQISFFSSITKYCATAFTVEEIPHHIENAFRAMRSPRPGPVMLEFPQDVIVGEGEATVPDRIDSQLAKTPDAKLIQQAAAKLRGTERPLILAGAAVIDSDARVELCQLAEKLGAPVAVTRRGKGALAENHDLALRNIDGFLGQQALQLADCTVAVGCRFTSIDTRNWTRDFPRPLLQFDPEAKEIGREYECDVGISGDLCSSLRSLADSIEGFTSQWTALLAEWRTQFAAQPPLPLLPVIREVLPEEGIISVDVHSMGYSVFSEYPIVNPRTFIYPCIGVSLGHAFPAALGAKIAYPERPVVCFCGDGGFLMGSFELATAVRYGINVVTIVINDRALTAIKGSQERDCEGRTIDTELTNPDFVAFAHSFGAYAERVDDLSQFREVFVKALESNRPALIEIFLPNTHEQIKSWITWLSEDPLRK